MSGHSIRRGSGFALLALLLVAVLALAGCGKQQNGLDPSAQTPGVLPPSVTGRAASSPAVTTTKPGWCDGTIGAQTVDEVTVPPHGTCRLVGTRVDGNVSVGSAGALVARGVDVDGDVEAEGARLVRLSGATIGGNVQVEQGEAASVVRSEIQGDLQWQEQRGSLRAQQNIVRGNLQADGNRGHVTIAANRIGGDLGCEENRGITGGGNRVAGSREGQCARL